MKTIILAGGKGVRLGSLSEQIPKPMIRIGGLPLIEHQIRLLKRYNLTEIILLTSHLSAVIEAYFGDGRPWGVRIQCVKEKIPLGTAGGFKEIESLLTDDFLVLYGDLLVDMNLRRLLDFHRSRKGIGTLALHANDHMGDSDLVEIDSTCRITTFHSKPHNPRRYYRNLVNAAVYVLSPRILSYLPKGQSADFGRDIFPCVHLTEPLYGYVMADYLKDIGTLERLESAKADYASGLIARMNGSTPRRAVFLSITSFLAEPNPGSPPDTSPALRPGAAAAIKALNRTDFLLVALLYSSSNASHQASQESLGGLHKIVDTLLGRERAKLDLAYYCSPPATLGAALSADHNNARGRLTSPLQAIRQAVADFIVDPQRSFLIAPASEQWREAESLGVQTIRLHRSGTDRDACRESHLIMKDIAAAAGYMIALHDAKRSQPNG